MEDLGRHKLAERVPPVDNSVARLLSTPTGFASSRWSMLSDAAALVNVLMQSGRLHRCAATNSRARLVGSGGHIRVASCRKCKDVAVICGAAATDQKA